MAAITKAYFDRMAGDATLVALLPTFNSEPNIFSSGFVPESAVLPWVEFDGQHTVTEFDTKDSKGRNIFTDIRSVGRRSGSAVEVEAIAERVEFLFKRHKIVIPGFDTITANCSGPESANSSEAIIRVVQCTAIIQEA